MTYSYPTYQVIDGQQRMITFSLLLTALRNLARDAGHEGLASEITNSVLVHQYKKGIERFRVYPRQRDREDFTGAVNGSAQPANRIGKALRFFTDEIKDYIAPLSADELGKFYNFLLNGLEFVHINLDGENPYKIFRSLNSTGVDLSPADLIRNFVFMGVPVEQQDVFDEERWTPLESHFLGDKNEVNAKQVSAFFRDFLMMNGQIIAPADTFEAFEERYKQDDGTGTYVQLTPTSLNFGNQPVGTESLAKKVTFSNKGAVAVNISGISVTGTNPTDFAQTNTCGTNVAAGASCFITVTFKPSATGTRSASVSVSDDGGGSPQRVSLKGTGT